MITTLKDIKNLLWFCDKCLPDIFAAFTSQNTQNAPQQFSEDSNQDDTQQNQKIHHDTRQSKSLADFVIVPPSISNSSIDTNDSVQMEMDDNFIESTVGSPSVHMSKKRKFPGDDDQTDIQSSSLSNLAVKKIPSTNYRCIYLTKFTPAASESDIIGYIKSKSREPTEVMECKKLIPTKSRFKLTYVSFKLTVHNEFYDVYADNLFWPDGVSACEFDSRQLKSRAKANTGKLRVNPFAVRTTTTKVKQNTQKWPSNKWSFKSNPHTNNDRSESNFHRHQSNRFNYSHRNGNFSNSHQNNEHYNVNSSLKSSPHTTNDRSESNFLRQHSNRFNHSHRNGNFFNSYQNNEHYKVNSSNQKNDRAPYNPNTCRTTTELLSKLIIQNISTSISRSKSHSSYSTK